jgi:hypothetical protein
MEYIEGEGFVLTKGDTWKRKLLVLQFVNKQGAWIDEVTMESNGNFKDNHVLDMISKFVGPTQPYRILERESTETLIEIVN